jgi:hypothetical protein
VPTPSHSGSAAAADDTVRIRETTPLRDRVAARAALCAVVQRVLPPEDRRIAQQLAIGHLFAALGR